VLSHGPRQVSSQLKTTLGRQEEQTQLVDSFLGVARMSSGLGQSKLWLRGIVQSKRRVVNVFILAVGMSLVCSSTACTRAKPARSYVCNSLSDAEFIYANHRGSLTSNPYLRCEMVGEELTETKLREIAAERRFLVYNDGASAIQLYEFEPHEEHPSVTPIEGATLAAECRGCEPGVQLGVHSGGVFQWCTWKGSDCLFRQLVPGDTWLIVEDNYGRTLGTSRKCKATKQETLKCVYHSGGETDIGSDANQR